MRRCRSAAEHWNVERGARPSGVTRMMTGLLDLPAPRLFGRHQFDNAGLADRGTARDRQPENSATRLRDRASSKAEWPARMQRLSSGALVGLAPANSEVLARRWTQSTLRLRRWRLHWAILEERVSRQLVVIVGMPSNKDAGGFLANFAGMTRHIIAVPIPDHENAYTPSALADGGPASLACVSKLLRTSQRRSGRSLASCTRCRRAF